MGTEFIRCGVKEEEMNFPAIPPGFESFTSFTLKKVEDSEKMPSCSASTSSSESHSTQMETEFDTGVVGMKKSRRLRPSLNYNQFNYSSGEESDSGKLGKIQKESSKSCLPKGVIRGCTDCRYCQKVSARWRPEDSCKPDLKDAPVFYPNEQEFEDTIKYIASIRPIAELYGICRIVPPPLWKPPCPLKQKNIWEESKFATRVQRIDKLQNRNPMRMIASSHNHMRTKKRRCIGAGIEYKNDDENLLGSGEAEFLEHDYFGFEPGPEFTLNSFQKYAEEFKSQYFRRNEVSCLGVSTSPCGWQAEPSVEHIEGEYWRVVEKPTEEIEVLYGADLETGSFGSGFPKMSSQDCSVSTDKYIKSGWNLNNFPRLPGSVLSYESGDISGVLVPWLYIGMCFSSFCWHVEDHHLYSLNYMHWGDPKLWYGVPASDALKLEATMRKKLPELFEEQPDLLHKLVTQLSPTILKSEGVPVYRCVQNSGEFVLTFPRAYHSGFNCGFNCAEAVNVAPVDWLPLGQHAIELYREQHRKTSISHDKLLLGAAREGVRALWEFNFLKKYTLSNLRWKDACGKNGILATAFKTRVEIEHTRRELLGNSLKALKMESDFDATTERECSICYFDLHLSAVGCCCSPDRYACLNHVKQFCTCALEQKIFIYRYDMNDLKILVEALEGRLSAIYRWARQDLQLSLSSYVIRDYLPSPGIVAKSSSSPKATRQKEMASPLSKESVNEIKVEAESMEISVGSSGSTCESTSLQGEKAPEALLASDSSTPLPVSCISSHKIGTSDLPAPCRKNQSVYRAPNITSSYQLSQDGTSSADIFFSGDSKEKKYSLSDRSIAIHFNDDKCKGPEKPSSDGHTATHATYPEISERLIESDDKNSLCNYKELILTTPVTTGIVMGEGDAGLLPVGKTDNSPSRSLCQKDEDQQLRGTVQGSFVASISCNIGSNTGGLRSSEDSLVHRSNNQSAMGNHDSQLQDIQFCGNKRTNNEDKKGIMWPSTNLNLIDNVRSISKGPVSGQNYLERNLNQKGPRVAKVVRRINCNIEPLDYGTVLSGKAWCNRQAIFPKGYRSRVRYISILDPTAMCYYISEILDGGRVGPLFMVSVEDCPNEIFVHVTACRCWDMVRERVNYEISRHHKLGTPKLPPLQPPGSLDGIEMFGFSSPVIVKEIMAMDRDRVCTEYWNSRPYSKFQVQLPGNSVAKECGSEMNPLSTKSNNQGACGNRQSTVDIEQVLVGLLKKANPEELLALRSLLNEDRPATGPDFLHLLTEEMNRPR